MFVVFLAGVACMSPGVAATVTPPVPTESPGPDLAATAAAAEAANAAAATVEAQLKAEATEEARAEQEATAEAIEAAETEQAIADREATAERATEAAAQRITRTARAEATVAQATAQAESLSALAAQLAQDGYLTRSDGQYWQLDDFSESWAQINWYQWWWTGYTPSDFVVRANFHWNSASTTANWFNSGCGFVFREASSEPYDHYLAYLGLDGVVYIERARNGALASLGSGNYGRLDLPEGEAEFVLAADGNKFTAYVNGKRVLTVLDGGRSEGNLNYTLISGTNRDYGTLCEITEGELWELNAARP